MWYDMYGTGRVFCRDCDEKIEQDPAAHAKQFTRPAVYYDADFVEDTVAAIRDLAALCRINNIKLVVCISPSAQIAYLTTNLERFARFKRELAGVTGYFDFSGLNSVNTNPYFYYEPLHYRPLLGDMMLNRIYGKPAIAVPADFGVYVTAATVEAHIRAQCLEVNKLRSTVSLAEVNARFAAFCAQPTRPSAGTTVPASPSPSRDVGRPGQ